MNQQTCESKFPDDKRPAGLDSRLEARLLLYALAAGAVLAGAPQSEGQVVFTPSHAVMNYNDAPLQIDMNHDGTTDFTLRDTFSIIGRCTSNVSSCSYIYRLSVAGYRENGVVEQSDFFAAALEPAAKIDSKATFIQVANLATSLGRHVPRGGFLNVSDRFLGVRFAINGKVHYGWIGFSSVDNFRAQLLGWAYETKPNEPIHAGEVDFGRIGAENGSAHNVMHEPTSLGLLAQGHEAIVDWRKRRLA